MKTPFVAEARQAGFLALGAGCSGLLLCLILSGCLEVPEDKSPRFHDASRVSVVFEYNSPEYVFMIKPACRQNGFLRQIHHPELPGLLNEMHVQRELAVVSLPWSCGGAMLRAVVDDWKKLLGGCGFRQVVFVRNPGSENLEGAVLVEVSNPT
jgi:hypothetical protein